MSRTDRLTAWARRHELALEVAGNVAGCVFLVSSFFVFLSVLVPTMSTSPFVVGMVIGAVGIIAFDLLFDLVENERERASEEAWPP